LRLEGTSADAGGGFRGLLQDHPTDVLELPLGSPGILRDIGDSDDCRRALRDLDEEQDLPSRNPKQCLQQVWDERGIL